MEIIEQIFFSMKILFRGNIYVLYFVSRLLNR